MVDAGANGLNYAKRGKPVAKRPRFLQKEAKWTLGVVPASEHHEILVAIASLIRAHRYDMALTILDNEKKNLFSSFE